MKGYSTFSTAPRLNSIHQIPFSVINWTFGGGRSYLFAAMLLVYNTVSADRAIYIYIYISFKQLSRVYDFFFSFLQIFYSYSKSKAGDRSRGRPKAPFSIATAQRCRGGVYSFPWIAPLPLIRTLYFKVLSKRYQVPFLKFLE